VSAILDLNDPLVVKFASYARERMRDYPELNRLTHKFDHSPRHLKWAVFDTLSDWHSTPPFLGHTLEQIVSKGWISLFTRGVVIAALESLGILHTRNFLSYSDGGVNVQTENPQLLQAWLQMFKNEYEQKKMRLFIARNIEAGLDPHHKGIVSEYFFINSFYGSW